VKFLLDTNAVAALMKGEPHAIERLRALRRADVFLPQPVLAEVAFGLARMPPSARRERLEAAWRALTEELQRAPWTDEVSLRFGQAKAELQRVGTPIEDFDLAIAAHALAYDAVVVTANLRHLGRVPGVRTEDWSSPER
jgi:tRNA(fMet)-specific endonuclease VapC